MIELEMEYKKGKRQIMSNSQRSVSVVLSIVFILAGLGILALFFFTLNSDMKIRDNYTCVTGTITKSTKAKSGKSGKTEVTYSYNGEIYEDIQILTYDSTNEVGDMIDVYIMPEAPAEPQLLHKTYILVFLAVFGVLCEAIAIGTLVKQH